MSKKERFTDLLKLIFQFHKDQIDLDFGVYRVFKHKEAELVSFIGDVLPRFIEECVSANKTEIGDAYNDVLEFFGRYYEAGDFYPVPRLGNKKAHILRHNGEEVIFSWANKDQYYIKSLDSFSTYRITNDNLFPDGVFDSSQGKCVLFQIANVDDIKGDQKKARYYVLNEAECFHDDEGLHVMLDYKVLSKADAKNQEITHEALHAYLTEKQINIGLDDVDYHLNKFKRLRKSDFFIHKNLQKFLAEELDYYIKSEIIRLDANDYHLRRAIVAKHVGLHIINFLAKLEDLQKQLWEKKKFIYDCQYVISLNKLAEYAGVEFVDSHADSILDNQKAEWKELGLGEYESIDVLKDDDGGYLPLPLDTKNFDQAFKWQLLEAISTENDLDEIMDGLCIHSDNWQALNVLQNKYRQKVKCIYIDPPYNTGGDGFPYKDGYLHSSWISMLRDRMEIAETLLANSGVGLVSIDDREVDNLKRVIECSHQHSSTPLIWNTNGHTDNQFHVKVNHEYVLLHSKKLSDNAIGYAIDPNTREESNLWKGFAENSITKNGPKNPPSEINIPSGFPVAVDDLDIPANLPSNDFFTTVKAEGFISKNTTKTYNQSYPVRKDRLVATSRKTQEPCRMFSGWASAAKLKKYIDGGFKPLEEKDGELSFYISKNGVIYSKKTRSKARNIYSVLKEMGTTESMSSELERMGLSYPHYPKPKELVSYLLQIGSHGNGCIILDYFIGSGTTIQAIQELNSSDELGHRKFLGVDAGKHFFDVAIPRVKKVSSSSKWNDAFALGLDGSGIFFKYHSLEQYEDTLENIALQPEASVGLDQHISKTNTLKPFGKAYEDTMLSILPHIVLENAKPLLLVEDELLNRPFDFTMRINIEGKLINKQMDLIETFNTLLGIQVQSFKLKEFEGNRYVFIDSAETVIIWREFEADQINDDFIEHEREFIEKHVTLDGKTLYMNGINQGCAEKQIPTGTKETLYKFRELLLEGIDQ